MKPKTPKTPEEIDALWAKACGTDKLPAEVTEYDLDDDGNCIDGECGRDECETCND